MTVGELVERLKDVPQDMEVIYCTYETEWFERLSDLFGGYIVAPDGEINSVEVDWEMETVLLKEEQECLTERR